MLAILVTMQSSSVLLKLNRTILYKKPPSSLLLQTTFKMSNQNTQSQNQSSSPSSNTHKTYTPSIQSTTSYASSKELLTSNTSSSSTTLKTKAKKFLSSVGNPPTLEHDRQQAAKNGISIESQKHTSKDGKQAFGAVNYGPYRTSTFGGERSLGRI
ncbi:hypothetical protein VTL71DRAFT_13656 [Oculimacula yallundae]|uniref:Uncharacterized protein n=1 Tax=Oculimacula yallundae TaxID=86028 RepID=A0ABR4CLF8_9HELO